MKNRLKWSVLLVCVLSLSVVTSAKADDALVMRILTLGDSWTHFMWFDHTFREVMDARSFAQFDVANIAMGGTKANQWASSAKLENTRAFLLANPDMNIVFFTLGGNDVMYGDPVNWFESHDTPEQEAAFFTWIAENVATVARNVVETRPDMHVVICSYDYMNSIKKAGNTCETTPAEALAMANGINDVMTRCEQRILQEVRGIERCRFVNNYGILQYELGYPGNNIPTWVQQPWTGECKFEPHWDPTGIDHFRFDPHQTVKPGQLEDNYVPFLGGDSTFCKSPWEAMLYYEDQWTDEIAAYGLDASVLGIDGMGPIDDWIHLGALGHRVVVNHCFEVCIDGWLNDYPYPKVASVVRSTVSPIVPSQVMTTTGEQEVAFTVTFNEAVSNVDAADFAVVSSGAVTGARVVGVEQAKDGATYVVTVDTGTGDGTLNLAVKDNDTIKNSAGHSLWGTGTSMNWAPGDAYTVDRRVGLPVAAWPAALLLLGTGVVRIRRLRR